jgi:hypothetical protein
MKRAGLVILVIGIIITIFTSFSFFTKEKVMDIGNVEISHNKRHSLAWSPVAGLVVMAIGGGVYLIGLKK